MFRAEICGTYDTGKVCAVLHDHGMMKRDDAGKRYTFKKKGKKGRFYILLEIPDEP